MSVDIWTTVHRKLASGRVQGDEGGGDREGLEKSKKCRRERAQGNREEMIKRELELQNGDKRRKREI